MIPEFAGDPALSRLLTPPMSLLLAAKFLALIQDS